MTNLTEEGRTKVQIGLTCLFFIGAIAFTILWAVSFYQGDDGTVFSTNRGVWSDFSMHASLIYFYIEQPISTILTKTPLLANATMPYPPFANLLSTFLVASGVPLFHAMAIQSIVFSYFAFACLLLLVQSITAELRSTTIAIVLFLLCGGLGFVDIFFGDSSLGDRMANGQLTNFPDRGLAFGNVLTSMWLPQRSFLSALGFVLLYFYGFRQLALSQKKPTKTMYFAISLVALIAFLGQAHSLYAMVIFSICFLGFAPRENRKKLIISGLGTAVLLLPWTIYLCIQGSGNLNFRLGLSENPLGQTFGFPMYFILNWVLICACLPFVWKASSKAHRQIVFVGLVFFAIGHIFILQPWSWDNMKVLVWAYFFWAIAAGSWLSSFMSLSFKKAALGCVIILALCLSGSLDLIGQLRGPSFPMMSERLHHHAKFIKDNTPTSAVIASDDFLYSPIAFAGRTRLCAYPGWLWSYGLDYNEPCRFQKKFFTTTGMYDLIRKYSVTHFIAPSSEPIFLDSNFSFEKVIGHEDLHLFKVLTPTFKNTEQ